MNIIGIAALYHDSSACLLIEGKLISAAQEERFTRIKHDKSFPINAINFCLKQNNLIIDDIDLIVFYEKPFIKFDRLLNSLQYEVPFAFNFFKSVINSWTKTKLWIPSLIKSQLNYKGKIIFSEHHEAHAAASFFMSPYEESAILVVDGVGEKACTTIAIGKGNAITILKEQHYPHSIGLLYSAFTQYCGFKVNSGEYKLMGLASYGKSVYKDLILNHIVSYTEDGVIKLNLKYFSFERGKSTINKLFCDLLGQPARKQENEIHTFYYDVASSIQAVIEDILVCLVTYTKKITQLDNLCLSGGVALNCKANGELLLRNIFENIWVQPASGDAGGALGAAFIGWYHHYKNKRLFVEDNLKSQIYLGSKYSSSEVKTIIDRFNLTYTKPERSEFNRILVEALVKKQIIGWFQGKMEFGPRALGHRSIIANPLFADMQKHVNLNIKKREGFRPFAPIILEEFANHWFSECQSSKYMTFTFKSSKKNIVPSCIHVDDTARVQTISKLDNEMIYDLLSEFNKKTECPLLINTSFNVRGEPIVESPLDALKCFFQTGMDILVLGEFILTKDDNTNVSKSLLKSSHYELD